jgi:regulator of replication initiation timing
MDEECNSLSEDQTIKGIITDLKLVVDQLGNNFTKAKNLIHELARRLDESKQCERDQVSRKIKKILKEEIEGGKITAKWIEDCLSPEYKRKYTTNSEVSSLSKENQKEIVVDASGNSIESAAISNSDSNNIVVNESRPPDVENLNIDTSRVGNDLEEVIKNTASFATADQLSEQAIVAELKTENEMLKSNLQSKSTENSALHIQIKELQGRPQNEQDRSFDVQFQYLFDPLQQHMASLFKKHIQYVSFIAKVDPVTKRILHVQIHEENNESEQTI